MFQVIRRFSQEHKLATVGAVIVLLFIVVGVMSPVIAPKDPDEISVANALAKPNKEFLLGADNNGRDILSRIMHGARVSLYISVTSVGTAAIVGVMLGVFAAWYRWLDMPIMRLMDVLLCFPGIVVALAVVSILGRGVENVIVAIAVYQVPQFARLTHGLVKSVKEKPFVEAAIASGEPDRTVLSHYIFPNILPPLIVQASLLIPSAIMTAATLSFIGLGVPPPTAEWGAMLHGSMTWVRLAPHIMIFPGLSLMLVVFGFNVLGDGLRDALDPRLVRR